jgi:membrane-associated protease RseP (regulator of RpoE activity)
MHMLQAFVLLFIVFTMVGVPGNHELAERLGGEQPDPTVWTLGEVTDGTAAEAAGLRVGDDVVSIDGQKISVWSDLGDQVAPNPGDTVAIVVVRDGETLELEATLGTRPPRAGEPHDAEMGFLGVSPTYPELPAVRVNPIRGLTESGEVTVELMGRTVTGLTSFFTGGVDDYAADVAQGGSTPEPPPSSSGSPVPAEEENDQRLLSIFGVARLGAGFFEEGLFGFLLLMITVNVSIGLLNMIPLLPLDGGHAAIATYERIRSIGGRRHMVDASRLLPITYAVFMFMMLLGVSAIYLDIVDPIG